MLISNLSWISSALSPPERPPTGRAACRTHHAGHPRRMWIVAILSISAVALGALGGVGEPHPDSQRRAAEERVPPPVDRAWQRDDRAKPLSRQSSPRPSTAPAAVPRRQLLWPAGQRDKNRNCVQWADQGECEKNPAFMQSDCAATCSKRPQDTLSRSECVSLSERGGCRSRQGAILATTATLILAMATRTRPCLLVF